jgi:DNA invertase Pin-like site-specific DNA recombinase
MSTSELVTALHLSRKAIIYIRQSSPNQVLTNQESTRLQYALRQRALELGWREQDVEVIDGDLGLSGTAVEHREGFKDLVARVTLGVVGIILSIEVQRLSRNCSDWYPLLDVCGYRGCLIADRDGVYDPASPNGRLLLGLKGQLSELELHVIRSRLTSGILNKAARGELALMLPIGLVRDDAGIVRKDPDLEVQGRIELVFATFLRVRSASRVLRAFNDAELLLPRRGRFGDIGWKKPTIAALLSTLKNPAYAGAFVYGRTRTVRTGPSPRQASQKALPVDEWRYRVMDKYPAYISWETYEKIRAMLRENHAEYDRNKTRGVPRPGAALLHGMVYCGECGHKMVVQYKSGTRYLCNYLRQQHGVPVCQYIPADPVDARVVAAFFEALSPAELDVYARAVAERREADKAVDRARSQQLERLRYQAALAERQFMRADPDNRLVASELERRWEEALRELKRAETEADEQAAGSVVPFALTAELKAAFTAIGQRLPELWGTAALSRERKKALLRCLIEKVVIHRTRRDTIRTRIVWRGGDTSTLDFPVTVGSLADLARGKELEERVVAMAREGRSDQEIADLLTADGLRSPLRDRVIVSTVRGLRLKHRILVTRSQSHPRRVPGYLTIPQMAEELGVTKYWLYDRIYKGTIRVSRNGGRSLYLFRDTPTTIARLKKLRDGTAEKVSFA